MSKFSVRNKSKSLYVAKNIGYLNADVKNYAVVIYAYPPTFCKVRLDSTEASPLQDDRETEVSKPSFDTARFKTSSFR